MRNPTIICVTGMGRSGTSLVARVLDLLGASLGPAERLMGPAESNPKGHWEHQPIVELNDEILALFGGSWDEPPVLAPGWHRAPVILALREKGRAITEAGFAGHDLWAWKDPRSSVTLPFWQDVLPPMKYIVCLRNPLDVAFSLRKRDGYPIEKSGRLWLTHLTLSIAHTSGHPRLLMFYEDLMDDWPAQVERMAAFIERPGAVPDPVAQQSIAEFVDRELEHHRTPLAESLQEPAIPFAAQALHLMLRDAVHASSPAGTNRAEEDARLSAAVDVISRSCLEADARLGETEEEMADLRERLTQLMRAVEAQDLKTEALTRELGVSMREKDEAAASLAEGLHAVREQLDEREKEIAAMVRSRSWRWTQPLRQIRGRIHSIDRRWVTQVLARLNHRWRRPVPEDPQRLAALDSTRRRMLSSEGLTADERRLLGPVPWHADGARTTAKPAGLTEEEVHLLSRVSLRVHTTDEMYRPGNPGHYLVAGLSAVRCIQQALAASGRADFVRTLLDFPCGSGRVLRFLKAMFPESRITACDLDATAVSFCRRVFSVDGVVSKKNVRKLSLAQKYDLIWCGSLITHLDERAAGDLLRFFHNHLSDQGLCIFTTHGQRSVDWLQNGTQAYGLSPEGQGIALRGFREKGYGYADYPGKAGYGISVASHSRMVEMADAIGGWTEACFLDGGWGNHHDVYAFAARMPSASHGARRR